MRQEQSQRELLRLLAKSSEQAYTIIYNAYSGNIFHAAMAYAKDMHVAQEIVQLVFITLWEKRTTAGGIDNLENYLFILARNAIFNHFKKTAREIKAKQHFSARQPQAADNTDHRVRMAQYNRLLESAISQLPPQRRTVYRLAREQGLSHEEIARQMKISSQTVKKHMALALQFVRTYLNRHLHPYVLMPAATLSLFAFR
ncbi:RNA polymerase sigma-70 factor [Chitinophaga sp.]|uniref:RNA polymerase sigma-70 factor n=1 Tax=Chitinophaga sp. TaxID=1869181 RepID=UPI0031D9770C